ncbi:lipid-A-disaccharide synthase [Pararhodospirillum photometricum]|uniref:Lipid-A-disaccharide synthase n=1 Tax=Pararhodospirillum photometricum DSM 122 TaxID=1150469 RepID=H6SMA1_PARPM|nr:lipid-A-disaccharide synthase [Pararhodospirillum photometricum]CCG06784.1 Lipid-A-disaccharide synthase [Pararhodospirillum photometricum DSM 122]
MTAPLIYLIAGEPSGDQLGAHLMRALKTETQGEVRFAGIGGEQMAAEGLDSLIPMGELAIMGFLEVLPATVRLMRRLKETVADIKAQAPAAVVTIDSWGFTGRVQAALRDQGVATQRIHYVAPMVWIWKAGRAKAVATRVEHLLCLWPFEPALFTPHGGQASHVGHAVIEAGLDRGDASAFRRRHGLAEDAPILLVLPGSRKGELRRLVPVFAEVVRALAPGRPDLQVVIPTLAHLRAKLEAETRDWPVPVCVVGGEEKADAFAAARAALAASGTISLELALAGVPHLVAYKVNPASAFLFRRVLLPGRRFVNMINILLDRLVVPELLQEACTAKRLEKTLQGLMDDETVRAQQRAGLKEAVALLHGGDDKPSVIAARQILAKI